MATPVESFLDQHPFLRPLVAEAHRHASRYFPDSEHRLRVTEDPEGMGATQLVLSIGTREDAATAMARLDRLDAEWWLDASLRAKGLFLVTVEFLP